MENQKEITLLQAICQDLKSKFEKFKEEDGGWDTFSRGYRTGYIGGLKYAIDAINYEIGIRLSPPNINYPGERPGAGGKANTGDVSCL
jgi:hypothetical protein